MFLYVLCFVQLNSIRSTEISFFFLVTVYAAQKPYDREFQANIADGNIEKWMSDWVKNRNY